MQAVECFPIMAFPNASAASMDAQLNRASTASSLLALLYGMRLTVGQASVSFCDPRTAEIEARVRQERGPLLSDKGLRRTVMASGRHVPRWATCHETYTIREPILRGMTLPIQCHDATIAARHRLDTRLL
jgi:hypothetical protein